MKVHSISAITLKVNEMESSCQFYSKIPGFRIVYGGASDSTFSTFEISEGKRKAYLNLELIEMTGRKASLSKLNDKHHYHHHTVDQKNHVRDENSGKTMQASTEQEGSRSDFGRIIFHTENVDDLYGYLKNDEFFSKHAVFETEPADAPWGERFFHIREPNGYQLSFAQPLKR